MIEIIEHSPHKITCQCPRCKTLFKLLSSDIKQTTATDDSKKVMLSLASVVCPECQNEIILDWKVSKTPEEEKENVSDRHESETND